MYKDAVSLTEVWEELLATDSHLILSVAPETVLKQKGLFPTAGKCSHLLFPTEVLQELKEVKLFNRVADLLLKWQYYKCSSIVRNVLLDDTRLWFVHTADQSWWVNEMIHNPPWHI